MAERGSSGRRHATRLLAVVGEMHKRGYQGLRVLPALNEDPFEWRCFLVLGRYMKRSHGAYWEGVEMGNSLPFTSVGGGQFLWAEKRAATARDLADQLEHGSLSSWLEGAAMDDFAYAGWFIKMLGLAERGFFPYAQVNGQVLQGSDPLPLVAWPDGSVAGAPPTPLPPAPRPRA